MSEVFRPTDPPKVVGKLYSPPCFVRIIRESSSYERPIECHIETKSLMCVKCGRAKNILHCDLFVVDRSASIELGVDELSYKYRIVMHICHECAIKSIQFTMEEFMMMPGVIQTS